MRLVASINCKHACVLDQPLVQHSLVIALRPCAAGHRVSRPRGTGSVGDSVGEGRESQHAGCLESYHAGCLHHHAGCLHHQRHRVEGKTHNKKRDSSRGKTLSRSPAGPLSRSWEKAHLERRAAVDGFRHALDLVVVQTQLLLVARFHVRVSFPARSALTLAYTIAY